jgi:hypothetical protein
MTYSRDTRIAARENGDYAAVVNRIFGTGNF